MNVTMFAPAVIDAEGFGAIAGLAAVREMGEQRPDRRDHGFAARTCRRSTTPRSGCQPYQRFFLVESVNSFGHWQARDRSSIAARRVPPDPRGATL